MKRPALVPLLLALIILFFSNSIVLATEQTAQDPLDEDWTEYDDEEELEVWDPIEPFNRGVFWFNDKLYVYLLKPTARGYRVVVPEPARESVGNVFHNLGGPVRVLNAFLQGKFTKGMNELTIFVANSTLGIGGIFDLHAETEGRPSPEDFGQTLGHYGSNPGFYLVLPILGPSNARDAIGTVGDSLTAPVPSPYYVKMKTLEVAGLKATDTVNKLSLDKDTYEAIKRDALDPYLFVRNAYMQNRAAKIDK
jgi:phospholipid-binding lipoprotein MlaA